MEILKIEDLSFSYPDAKEDTLRGVSLSVREGEFLLVIGGTGSGKTTLLRHLKPELSPRGEKRGRILFGGRDTEELSGRESASSIGFIAQMPDEQIVCDKVSHELAFGLECLGTDQKEMARRVAETASYFGIDKWFDKRISELSGGQKQLLNLASVMVTDPSVLVLDEPTSQLDPIAASEFISTLRTLASELSLTVIITEHRLNELIPIADRIAVLEDGKLSALGTPREVFGGSLSPELLASAPCGVRLHHFLKFRGISTVCPMGLGEGRAWIRENITVGKALSELSDEPPRDSSRKTALEFDRVFFRYRKELPDTLKELSFKVYEGEIFCILGGNGSGKTTCLRAAMGLVKPYGGSVSVFGKKLKSYAEGELYKSCIFLPQDVRTMFLCDSVREELREASAEDGELSSMLTRLLARHPYDLSGGEMQTLALAKLLARSPRLLLADEPTKGLDGGRKEALASLFLKLKASGMTLVIVTHDVEFAALCADRVGLFFGGAVVSEGTPREFFQKNRFYTTEAHRLTRGIIEGAVSLSELETLCLDTIRRREGER